MPRFDYICPTCGFTFEAQHPRTATPLYHHACAGVDASQGRILGLVALVKRPSAVPAHFHGGGFYASSTNPKRG